MKTFKWKDILFLLINYATVKILFFKAAITIVQFALGTFHWMALAEWYWGRKAKFNYQWEEKPNLTLYGIKLKINIFKYHANGEPAHKSLSKLKVCFVSFVFLKKRHTVESRYNVPEI